LTFSAIGAARWIPTGRRPGRLAKGAGGVGPTANAFGAGEGERPRADDTLSAFGAGAGEGERPRADDALSGRLPLFRIGAGKRGESQDIALL